MRIQKGKTKQHLSINGNSTNCKLNPRSPRTITNVDSTNTKKHTKRPRSEIETTSKPKKKTNKKETVNTRWPKEKFAKDSSKEPKGKTTIKR